MILSISYKYNGCTDQFVSQNGRVSLLCYKYLIKNLILFKFNTIQITKFIY